MLFQNQELGVSVELPSNLFEMVSKGRPVFAMTSDGREARVVRVEQTTRHDVAVNDVRVPLDRGDVRSVETRATLSYTNGQTIDVEFSH